MKAFSVKEDWREASAQNHLVSIETKYSVPGVKTPERKWDVMEIKAVGSFFEKWVTICVFAVSMGRA